MLPDDWGHPASRPLVLSLPGDWQEILTRYRGLGPSDAFDAAVKVPAERATRALLERDYIDADYRAEYANFYAQTFRPIPDRCERLHFFDDDSNSYLGFIVLRPIKRRPVSRTILRPPKALDRSVSCQAKATATPYGYRQTVEGFPFISQDYQYGVCAHAAIWMIARYHHLAFQTPRYLISDIVASARTHQDRWRLTPSEGLSFRQIVGILHDLRMPPVTYPLRANHPDDRNGRPPDEIAAIASRYLSSRLPVLLLQREHATVLIGQGIDDNTGEPFFVSHDDKAGPYRAIANESLRDWEDLLVPLPGRIYISGEAAEEAAHFIIRSELASRSELQRFNEMLDHGGTRLKTYVIPAGLYKRQLRNRGLLQEVVRWHVNVSTSHWIWMVELQDRAAAENGSPCVIGEIAIDATSDKLWPNPLFANLPGFVLRWQPLGGGQLRQPTPMSDLYESGAALP
jgi:hypothetical protein